jgi:hypothetical protein
MTKPTVAGAVIGAAVGAVVGYMYFTDEGRRRINRLGMVFDQLATDVSRATESWQRLSAGFNDYTRNIHHVVGDSMTSRQTGPRGTLQ